MRSVLLGMTALLSLASASRQPDHYEFETVTGYFLQDDPATDPATFDYTAQNFGLINRAYDTDSKFDPKGRKTQWQRFEAQVESLNRKSDRHTTYKVLFMGRHGEGYHNAAETFYGTPAWNCYWGLRDGNDTAVWADADLTPEGITQAKRANNYWASQLKNEKIPSPESFYSSPLTRCLRTAAITFDGIKLKHSFKPEVKEFLREGVSGRTCDRRGSKTYIKKSYPKFEFEKGFAEKDPLWKELQGEPGVNQDARSYAVLNEIFSEDRKTWLVISSHSGEIASLLRTLKHRVFRLNTGSIIPVLVKARRVGGQPTTTALPYTAYSPVCTAPPTATPAAEV